MFNLNILRLSSIVLISMSSCLCALAPASIQVLSPSEFAVILAPDENGTLLDVQININKEFGSGEPDYRKKNVTGRVIHFSERSLILKRGDIIYYSLTFDDGDIGLHGEDGNYIFDGVLSSFAVYKPRYGPRREVYEQNSEENNVNQDSRYLRPLGHPSHHGPHHRHHFGPPRFFPPPFGVPHHPPPYPGSVYKPRDSRRREVYEQNYEETSEEKNVNQNSRYLRHGPLDHPSHHGPHHRHHFGPPHYFPPPFGAPHHPPPYPGPDSWREHGYEHKDNFKHHGPWEDHDRHDCDSFGHKPKYFGGEQRPNNSKPWRGGPEDNSYPDNNGNNGFDRPSDGKPNIGTDSENDIPNESDASSKNDNNTTTENPTVEVV